MNTIAKTILNVTPIACAIGAFYSLVITRDPIIHHLMTSTGIISLLFWLDIQHGRKVQG